jgi:hypothetical protein
VGSAQAEFAKAFTVEIGKWAKVVRSVGIEVK